MFKKNLDVCPNDLPIEHGVALRVYVPDFDGWFADQMSVLTRHERVFFGSWWQPTRKTEGDKLYMWTEYIRENRSFASVAERSH